MNENAKLTKALLLEKLKNEEEANTYITKAFNTFSDDLMKDFEEIKSRFQESAYTSRKAYRIFSVGMLCFGFGSGMWFHYLMGLLK